MQGILAYGLLLGVGVIVLLVGMFVVCVLPAATESQGIGVWPKLIAGLSYYLI